MTVSNTQTRIAYVGDGITTDFSTDFIFISGTDVNVYVDGAQVVTGFAVTGGSGAVGTVEFLVAPALNAEVVIVRNTDLLQETDIPPNDPFPADTVERMSDKLTLIVQEHATELDRTLRLPPFAEVPGFELPYPLTPLYYWRNNAAGDNVEFIDLSAGSDATALAAALAAPGGSDLVGFLQAGANAEPRTLQSKSREYIDMSDYAVDGVIDTTGTTEETAVFNKASAAAASLGKGLRLPAGTILLDAVTLPTTLPALAGRSARGTVLKFKRQAYSAGQVLLDASNNTAGIELSRFTIDCDDAQFKTAAVKPLQLSGSDNSSGHKLHIIGRGDAAIFADTISDADFSDISVDCTGTAGNSFVATFYMQNASRVTVSGLRSTGLPGYGAAFAPGSTRCKFHKCYIDGTSAGFGIWLSEASRCSIIQCSASNTYAEAFQITNGSYNTIALNNAVWDSSSGIDAACSINGEAGKSANYNLIFGNTFDNSKHAGLIVANNAAYNALAFNTLHQCGVRGTAAGDTGSGCSAMSAYADISGANCSTNTFRNNRVIVESGTVTNGYAEFNTGGGGSAVVISRVLDNDFYAAGGTITTRYTFAAPTSSYASDVDLRAMTLTPSSSAGSGVTITTNAAWFRERAQGVEYYIDVTITAVGTSSGVLSLAMSGPPSTGAAVGYLNGGVNTTAQACIGYVAGTTVAVTKYDASSVIAAPNRVILSGVIRR